MRELIQIEIVEFYVWKPTKNEFKGDVLYKQKCCNYINLDVWGSVTVSSNGDVNYFLNLIDNFSIKAWDYFMKHKSGFYIFKQRKA